MAREVALSKSHVARELTVACGLTQVEASKMVDAIFGSASQLGIICEALQSGDPVVISGFGTLARVASAERKVRNVRTGEPMVRPAGRRIRFTVGKTLKARLESRSEDQ